MKPRLVTSVCGVCQQPFVFLQKAAHHINKFCCKDHRLKYLSSINGGHPPRQAAKRKGTKLKQAVTVSHRCQGCGRQYSTTSVYDSSLRKFCNRRCGGMSIWPVGRIRIEAICGKRYKLVKTGDRGQNKYRHFVYVRLDILLLQHVLGRKLTKSERHSVVFVDGNTLNCSLDNLIIRRPEEKILRCEFGHYRKRGKDCRQCHIEKVSCIRALWMQGELGKNLSNWFLLDQALISKIGNNVVHRGVLPMGTVWKELLKRHDKLLRNSAAILFDRVTLLRRVYEDIDFLEAMRKSNSSPIEVLDSRVRDTCVCFMDLLQILKMFPQRNQWVNGDLAVMRSQMLMSVSPKREVKLNGNRTLSWKQKYLELEAKYKQLESAYNQLEKDHRELRLLLRKKPA